ncbi:MAG TPA: hypothetical protein VFO48_02175 [Vicinamibacterales bacterium]|nr:hypothetical protein [Vicinamibacterales bacterium]
MASKLESQIDDLCKLPLDEFTKARNALAKTLSGGDKKAVASLVKPSVAMWIVNQLYWQDAATYKALVDASEKLRAAHRAALNGKTVDTRRPDELHRTTLEKALVKAIAIAQKKGATVTDPVRDAVRRTLAAVPTNESPGRLTREPPAVGFSLLTGIKPRAVEPQRAKAQEAKRRKAEEAKARQEEEKARKEKERRERDIKKAEQALRDAERRLAELKG